MSTDPDLPGWFPDDFKVDPALMAAHEVEDTARAKAQHKAVKKQKKRDAASAQPEVSGN